MKRQNSSQNFFDHLRHLTYTASLAALLLVFALATAQAQEVADPQYERHGKSYNHYPELQFSYATAKEISAPGGTLGTVTCVGGRLTGLPSPPCTPETKYALVRGAVRYFNYQELAGPAAAFFNGTPRYVFNCNLNANYSGPCWGTFEWPIDGKGGKWEGTFTATIDLLKAFVIGSASGYGVGGDLEGLQMRYDILYPGGVPYGTAIMNVTEKNR